LPVLPAHLKNSVFRDAERIAGPQWLAYFSDVGGHAISHTARYQDRSNWRYGDSYDERTIAINVGKKKLERARFRVFNRIDPQETLIPQAD
jgi:hypothetical protein